MDKTFFWPFVSCCWVKTTRWNCKYLWRKKKDIKGLSLRLGGVDGHNEWFKSTGNIIRKIPAWTHQSHRQWHIVEGPYILLGVYLFSVVPCALSLPTQSYTSTCVLSTSVEEQAVSALERMSCLLACNHLTSCVYFSSRLKFSQRALLPFMSPECNLNPQSKWKRQK